VKECEMSHLGIPLEVVEENDDKSVAYIRICDLPNTKQECNHYTTMLGACGVKIKLSLCFN